MGMRAPKIASRPLVLLATVVVVVVIVEDKNIFFDSILDERDWKITFRMIMCHYFVFVV
jgi:hypothetical protein